jgi:glucosylceramidase
MSQGIPKAWSLATLVGSGCIVGSACIVAACGTDATTKPEKSSHVPSDAGPSGPAKGSDAGADSAPPLVLPALVTSTEGAYWVTSGALQSAENETVTVTVDDGSTAQTWEGFCGAFNEKGWDYLSLLDESDRDRALELLFGADGCRFPMARIPIGATDYAMDRYTLDEVPSGSTDPRMDNFSIDRDEEKLIPFVKAAQAVNSDLRFWASPWTPPTWMKDGPFNDDSPFDGGSMKSDATTLRAFARYFVNFVQAYAERGIGIELVSAQNEPGYSGTYPTCAWEPATYRDFIGQYLGPALADAGLDTGILLGTFNGGSGDTTIVSETMGDPDARSYVQRLGYQWGMFNNVADAAQYDVPIWQTEHQCGNYPWLDGFVEEAAPNDHAYAVESWTRIRNWVKAGVTAYGTWNMVLDTVGVGIDTERPWPQDSLLTVDTKSGTLNVTPAYYVFRHLSQFVDPGATVLGTSGGDALAFENPSGTIVTVMYNSGDATKYVLSVHGEQVQFDMPANGWATVVQ